MCKRVIAVTPLNPRAMPAVELKAIASKWCDSVSVDDSIEHGIRRALRESGEQDLILIFGSLYLAGDARRMVLQWKEEGSL
ncbi:MAG: bifunctional folylpolyglutamate synthase/dihydrofolate synthase, partial [Oscillospiraceae bacterium]